GAVHRAELGVAEHFGLDDLEGHFLARKGVHGEVDRSGRALAELFADVVLADLQAEIEVEGGVAHARCSGMSLECDRPLIPTSRRSAKHTPPAPNAKAAFRRRRSKNGQLLPAITSPTGPSCP